MDPVTVVRKVIQDVFMFVCHQQGIVAVKPSPELRFVPEITSEFLKDLSLAAWIDSYRNETLWEKFLCKHFRHMTASPYRFANYVSYACYLFHRNAKSAFESFTKTLSLVIHFVLYSWRKGHKEFLSTCVDLFCDFFEKEILSEFLDQGAWENFNKHLEVNHEDLGVAKDLIENGKKIYVLFKEMEIEHDKNPKPQEIGGVLLKDITKFQVLDDKEAASFADSVAIKMQKLVFRQTIEEIMADFKKTDQQVEKLYRQMTGEATGGTDIEVLDSPTSKVEQSSARKEKDVNIKTSEGIQSTSEKDQEVSGEKTIKVQQSTSQKPPKQTNAKKKKQKAPLPNPKLDSEKSQDVEPAIEELGSSPKLTKVEKAKILLRMTLDDIKMVREMIKFLCVETPTQTVGAV